MDTQKIVINQAKEVVAQITKNIGVRDQVLANCSNIIEGLDSIARATKGPGCSNEFEGQMAGSSVEILKEIKKMIEICNAQREENKKLFNETRNYILK